MKQCEVANLCEKLFLLYIESRNLLGKIHNEGLTDKINKEIILHMHNIPMSELNRIKALIGTTH